MIVKYTLWTRRDMKYAGKITLAPEGEQEAVALRIFKMHAGIEQPGRKLDIVYRWKEDAKRILLMPDGIASQEAFGRVGQAPGSGTRLG